MVTGGSLPRKLSASADRRLRVAIVTTSFPVVEYASGIFVARLAGALAERVSLEVITPAGTKRGIADWHGIPIHAIRYAPWQCQKLAHAPGGIPVALRHRPSSYLLLPIFLAAMFWACLRRARNFDLFHANWVPVGLCAGIVGKCMHVPVVTTVRGEDASRIASSWGQRGMMRACVHLSRYVVCVSEAMTAEMKTMFPENASKFLYIPNGIGSDFSDVGREEEHEKQHKNMLTLIMVGSLIPRKCVDVAINAVARILRHSCDGVRLIVVGDGPEAARLRQQVDELDLRGKVEFRGAVPPEDVPAQFFGVDAMLLCSTSEGRPNAVLEGMAAGLPIIATDIPGVRELIRSEREGLLFPTSDIVALSTQIQRLQCDPQLRKRMSVAARDRVRELGLTWESAAAQYAEAYATAVVSGT